MAPQKPEDWPRQFEQHVNAGELEAALALYDPEARFVSPGDRAVAGVDGVRRALAGLISMKAQLRRERSGPAGASCGKHVRFNSVRPLGGEAAMSDQRRNRLLVSILGRSLMVVPITNASPMDRGPPGSEGGRETLRRHGVEHFREIGKKGWVPVDGNLSCSRPEWALVAVY